MPFISREMLHQQREAGLARRGGLCEDQAVLAEVKLSVGATREHIARMDELLKARWNHPEDLRILSRMDEVFGENWRHPMELVDAAASYVWCRDRGETLLSREVIQQQRCAYDDLCFAVMQRCMLQLLS